MSYSNYQTPELYSYKKRDEAQRKKGIPGGGWDEDNDEKVVKTSNNLKGFMFKQQTTSQPLQFEKRTESNFKQKNEEKQQSTVKIDVETKLIEDITNPNGISLKPSENSLKDFCRRAKNLNKEAIFNILLKKLSNHERMIEGNEVKILMKCLYVIESLLQNKIEDFNNLLNENQQIFTEIQNNQNYNKKLVDVTKNILNILNGVMTNNVKTDVTSTTNTKKIDLLDFNEDKTKESVNLLETKYKSNTENNNKASSIDLLGLDVSNPTSNITNQQKTFKFIKKDEKKEENINVLEVFSEGLNESTPAKTNNENTTKSSFKFIKCSNKSVADSSDIKNLTSFDNLIENVSIISPSIKNKETTPEIGLFDLTKANKPSIEEIWSVKPSSSKKVDINVDSLFEEKYKTSPGNNTTINHSIEQHNINLSSTPLNLTSNTMNSQNFNYDLVNQTINQKKKDHFDFVNDLLKKK